MSTHTCMRKRRTGRWSMSTGQGNGQIQDDTDTDSDSNDDDADSGDLEVVKREAIKRRIENKKLRKDNERLKAQLGNGREPEVDPKLQNAFLKAAVKSNRPIVDVDVFLDLASRHLLNNFDGDPSEVTELVEAAFERWPYLLEAAASTGSENRGNEDPLPGTGASHRRTRKPSGPNDDELRRKYGIGTGGNHGIGIRG